MADEVRRGWPRRILAGSARARRRHPGRFGLASGVIVGVVLTALWSAYVAPVLAGSTELEKHDLVLLTGKDDSFDGQRGALVKQWNELHHDNQVTIKELPAVADAQHSEMASRAEQEHSGVDIYNLDLTWIAEFASQHYIRPLDVDGLDLSGFLPAPRESCYYDGKLWALPFNSDAGLLYYRTTLVPTPPTDWKQLTTATADALSRPAGDEPRPEAGYAGQLLDYEGLTVNALEAIWGAGGDVVDGDGNVVINSPQAKAGLEQLATGLRKNTPQLILTDSRDFDETKTTEAFADGRTVFMRNWPVAHRTLNPPPGRGDQPAAKVAFGVTELPGAGHHSVLGGQDLAISADTEAPRAAQALIEFLTSDRSQQILFERGGLVATRDVVYQDPAVRKLYPYADTLLNAIRDARPRPVTPYYNQFSREFRAVVLEAFKAGGIIPPDARQRLTDALKGYRR